MSETDNRAGPITTTNVLGNTGPVIAGKDIAVGTGQGSTAIGGDATTTTPSPVAPGAQGDPSLWRWLVEKVWVPLTQSTIAFVGAIVAAAIGVVVLGAKLLGWY